MSKQHFKEYIQTIAKSLWVSVRELSYRAYGSPNTLDNALHENTSIVRKIRICHSLREFYRGVSQ